MYKALYGNNAAVLGFHYKSANCLAHLMHGIYYSNLFPLMHAPIDMTDVCCGQESQD
jgi:hypothetical protein